MASLSAHGPYNSPACECACARPSLIYVDMPAEREVWASICDRFQVFFAPFFFFFFSEADWLAVLDSSAISSSP